jgi:hypothetical protein
MFDSQMVGIIVYAATICHQYYSTRMLCDLRFRMKSMSEAVGHCDGAESTAFQPSRCKSDCATQWSGGC